MSWLTVQKFCSWCAILTGLTFFGGFVIGGFFPPPPPSLPQDQVVAMYQTHQNSIMIGMMVWMASTVFMCFFSGVLSEQLRRIPGAPPALSYAQLASAAVNMIFFIVPPTLFIVTAYRPDRPPELTYMLNDFSWIMAVLPWPGATAQSLAVGLAILVDTGAKPIFPRWTGWYNIFCALAYMVGTGLIFVKSGPFAWNSIFPFWFAGSVFFIWFVIMHFSLLEAFKSDPANKPGAVQTSR